MSLKIIKNPIKKKELKNLAKGQFATLVKVVIDVEQGIMAVGAEMHADEEAALLENGSKQKNLWGINIYPFENKDKQIEFDSVINIRPSQNNRSRGVGDKELREKIIEIVNKLVTG